MRQYTGTFFWEMTTAQLFPRTLTEVMFAAVIALNAYSVDDTCVSDRSEASRERGTADGYRCGELQHTDLIQTTLV